MNDPASDETLQTMPSLDWDSVRPILPLQRSMHEAGKLTPAQAYFFRSEREIEQLYEFERDRWELNNLTASAE